MNVLHVFVGVGDAYVEKKTGSPQVKLASILSNVFDVQIGKVVM